MRELGRFRLRSELASGPYTVTYDAQDGTARCVVKVLKDEAVPSDKGRRAGLVRALEGLKAIEHPSAVRVLDAGEEGGKLFVASEFMDCPTLARKLAEQKRLPEQQVVLYIRQSGQALDKARDVGYCHGDLSAGNVFVVSPEKVKLSDFALRALIQDPPELSEAQAQGEPAAAAAQDEWVTAEDLLRTKGKKATKVKLDDDFVGLAVLMLQMLGVEAPARGEQEALPAYREKLMRRCYPAVSDPSAGVSVHVSEVVRRLLTQGGFDSPGEVVVELASAMLLGRTFGRARPEAAARPAAAAAETAQVRVVAEEETEEPFEVEAPEARPRPIREPASRETVEAVTAFFIWSDRRTGRFFVLHDGERISVGRDPDACDVTLMDPAVSRKHCTLSKEGGVITIADAGSGNGTFVNDERVERAEIKPGDRLRVGATRLHTSLPGGAS